MFPGILSPILVGRKPTLELVKYLEENPNAVIAIVSQKDSNVNDPQADDIYMTGIYARFVRAFDMFVTGRPVDAKEAFQIGLIKEITAKEDLLPKTMAFAKKLTKGPALAYRNMKKLMFESMYKDFRGEEILWKVYLIMIKCPRRIK